MPAQTRVTISSTARDLPEHRKGAMDVVSAASDDDAVHG